MDNIIVFHGPDHKSGVTMLAQSVGQYIAEKCVDLKVMLLCLNPKRSTEFAREVSQTIEKIKPHLDHKTLKAEDILSMCRLNDNFYMLGGIDTKGNSRTFYPETSAYLINMIKDEFDVIICDAGNDIDNGLTIGALENASYRVAVITQQESMLKAFSDAGPLYEKLGFTFDLNIINKFDRRDPYDLAYIAMRLQLKKGRTQKVAFSAFSRQAEMEYKTILNYKEGIYTEDIKRIANILLVMIGLPEISKRRRLTWRNSI